MSPTRRAARGSVWVIVFLVCPWALLAGQTQESSFAAYLKQHAQPLAVTDGRFQGPGASWLVAEARRAQFVLIGEEHGLAEMETLTEAFWRLALPLGFRHLAVEEGLWSASLADRYVRRGDESALEAYRSAALKWTPPASGERLALLRALRQTAPGGPLTVLWGIDQERRAVPLLAELLREARTDAARLAAKKALEEAKVRESQGHTLLDGYSDTIQALRRAFSGRQSSAARRIHALMEQSNRIYDHGAAPVAEARGFAANEEREDLMKDNFLAAYRQAQRQGRRNPRVLLRVGQWHGMRGLSPTRVTTLGNFVSEFARAEGGSLLNVVVACATGKRSGVGKSGGQAEPCGAEGEDWFKPVMDAMEGSMTLFDLRPLRAVHHAGMVDVPEEVIPYVYAYDVLLVIAKSSPLHFPVVR